MATRHDPCAASWLLVPLLTGPSVRLAEVARTPLSVHYETDDLCVPVLTVAAPDALRLPNSLVTTDLPEPVTGREQGGATVGEGALRVGGRSWQVRRWWRPERPAGLVAPPAYAVPARPTTGERRGGDVPAPRSTYDGLRPAALLGAGPGLTPAGDDVLAGAAVTAFATADPRLAGWRRELRRLLDRGLTTAVSRSLLHHALDGYATAELADYLTTICRAGDVAAATERLLRIGSSSGLGLLTGVLHTLSTRHLEDAA